MKNNGVRQERTNSRVVCVYHYYYRLGENEENMGKIGFEGPIQMESRIEWSKSHRDEH